MNTETKALLPTKEELLNQNLVSIDSEHKAITTNTLKTAQYFGRNHKNVLQRITTLIKNSRLKIQPSTYMDSRGKERIYYILDRKNFSIVVLGFTGAKAEKFRINYVEQFEEQAIELIEWQKTRQSTIAPLKNANSSIAWLQAELLKELPKSSKSKRLFIHIQNGINKAATGSSRTKRDEMTIEQLKLISWLEVRVYFEIDRMKGLGASAEIIRESILETLKSGE